MDLLRLAAILNRPSAYTAARFFAESVNRFIRPAAGSAVDVGLKRLGQSSESARASVRKNTE